VWSSADGVTWEKHANALPTEMDRHASVVFLDKMWIFGGAQGSTSASDVVYVSDNGTLWTNLGSLPAGLSHAEAVVFNDEIVLLGGTLSNGDISNAVWKSGNGLTWTEVGSNALAGKNFSNRTAAVFGDGIWIVGNNQNDDPTTFVSRDGGESWNAGPLPHGKVFHGSDLVVFDNTLWLIGGYDSLTPAQADTVQLLGSVPRNSCNPHTFEPTYLCEEDDDDGSSTSGDTSGATAGDTSGATAGDTSGATAGDTSGANDGGTSGTNGGGTSGTNGGGTSGTNGGGTSGTNGGGTSGTNGGGTSGTNGGGSNNGGTNGGGSNGGGTGGNFAFARAACGNGRKEGREACDDGNNRNRDGCSSSCELEGSRRPTSPGTAAAIVREELRAIARENGCGNGLREAGEQCDDGNQINRDGCSELCKGELEPLLRSGSTCGNGLKEIDEECDKGTENSDSEKNGCRKDCTNARCGDFVLDNGEECDNGPANDDDRENACRTNCRLSACGDNTIDSGEECDDGNIENGDGCSSTCSEEDPLFASASVCGDGTLARPEECDDGNSRDGDGCNTVCQLEIGICGDGIVQELLGEQCESSTHDVAVGYACSDCQFFSTSCGDDTVDPGETCDEGAENSDQPGAVCRPNCHMARCGDNVLDPEEECDDGNRVGSDGCDWSCAIETGTLVLGTQIDFGENPSLNIPTAPTRPNSQLATRNSQLFQFPQYPTGQPLPYQLPIAQLRPLMQSQGPVGDTGPAAVAVVASGMAAGFGWIRRKKR
jgi:cysteine-rich repeat protein